MPLISQSVQSLYGGVSQQSPVQRADNQAEAAKNCSFTVATGFSKRPPLEVINQLTSTDLSGVFCHWISDRNNDKYLMTVNNAGDIDVYRTSDGVKLTVLNDTANPYLVTTDAVNQLRAYTVEEKTYIVNTTVEVEIDTNTVGGTLTGTVQNLQDSALDSAGEGSIYAIIGDTDNEFDTYYAKKVSGKWVEWIKPGIQDTIKASTMPYHLELFFDEVDPNGVRFEFLQSTWANKLVGDEKSNKFPSFVGNKITGIYFASDRLCFLSGSATSMSETSEHDNFFRTTVTDVLASDRIDIKEASDDSTAFYYAKPLGQNIMTFSANKQWALAGDPILTPQTVGMTLATKYQSSTICEPQNAGSNLYFVVQSGEYTEVRELYVTDDAISTSATNITAHVPRYIPKNVRLLAVQNNLDFICCYSDETPNSLWVNQYKYSGNNKVQSAWGEWDFGSNTTIIDLEVIDHYLYAVYTYTELLADDNTTTRTYIGRINIKDGDSGIADGFSHPINLDFLEKITGVYDSNTNATTFTTTHPFLSEDTKDIFQIVKGNGWSDMGTYYENGQPDNFVKTNGTTFVVTGDWTQGDTFLGIPYLQEFTFSLFVYKDSQGANLNVRNQIRNMTISFTDTAYFQTYVKRAGDLIEDDVLPDLFNTYTSRTLGADHFRLNRPQLTTGDYTFPILSKNSDVQISIRNNAYTPCNIQTAAYKTLISARLR